MSRSDETRSGAAPGRTSWPGGHDGSATRPPVDEGELRATAVAAHLAGDDDRAVAAWDEAHRRLVAGGDAAGAARCAFWIGMTEARSGRHARATGWFTRGGQVLDAADLDVVERGYLLVPSGLGALGGDDPAGALAVFEEVSRIAGRFGDADLASLARLGTGQSLVRLGDVSAGLARLDAAMVGLEVDHASPLVVGIVYCAVILTCHGVFAVDRAREWTHAMSRWCDDHPGLVPYRGQCLVHRSQLLQMDGDWEAARTEAGRAHEHLSRDPTDPVLGMARYQLAELDRHRGALVAAEAGYLAAGEHGHHVQPGLALLRLAQGRTEDALAALLRESSSVTEDARRAAVLHALVQAALAARRPDEARVAADDLGELATRYGVPLPRALAAEADGAVLLASGDAASANARLAEARACWTDLRLPYETARTRLLVARCCDALGDHDTAARERTLARAALRGLGTSPDVHELVPLGDTDGPLSDREVEVLALVAHGHTNREVAERLVLSEHTVARHLQNAYVKLGVHSRTAAVTTARARGLLP